MTNDGDTHSISDIEIVGSPEDFIFTNEEYSFHIDWTLKGKLPPADCYFDVFPSIVRIFSDDPPIDLDGSALIVPVGHETDVISFSEKITIPANVVPAGNYKLVVTINLFDSKGKPLPWAGFREFELPRYVEPPEKADTSYSEFTLITRKGQQNTPYFLSENLTPYLIAIADIQKIINEIQSQSNREVVVKSITQHTPITVSLDGAAKSVEIIRNSIVPWRKKHDEKMAQLIEQEKLTNIEGMKAEILEKRAGAAKNRAEADKLNADAAKQREEVEGMKLKNEKLRLELHHAKIQMALDILSKLSPSLSEPEKIDYLVRLLPAIDVVISSEFDVAASRISK